MSLSPASCLNRESDRNQINRSDGEIHAMTTTYHIADIRNVALAGHGASGKTSLGRRPALHLRRDQPQGLGRRRDQHRSTSTRKRNAGISRSTATWATSPGTGKQVHLIDTPGLSRLHRQRPECAGGRRKRGRGRLGPVRRSRSTPGGCFRKRAGWAWAGSSWSPRWTPRTSITGQRPGGDPRDVRHPVRAVQRAGRAGLDRSRASST